MTRDEFLEELGRRRRLVRQKLEREQVARLALAADPRNADLRGAFDLEQQMRENAEAEEALFLWDILLAVQEGRLHLITASRPSGAHGPDTPVGPITDLGDGELRETRQVGEGHPSTESLGASRE